VTGKQAASPRYGFGIDTVELSRVAATRVEAESAVTNASTAPYSAQPNCCGLSWSGGYQLFVQPRAVGEQVTVDVTAPRTGDYRLVVGYTQAPDYGTHTVTVDGAHVGDYDAYHPSIIVDSHDYGTLTLTAGTHQVTFTATGKQPAASAIRFGVDNVDLVDAGVHLEAEALPAVADTTPPRVQTNCCGLSFSAGAHLWWPATLPGERLTLRFTVPATGRYDLTLHLTTAPDYTTHTALLDNTVLVYRYDNAGPFAIREWDYGAVDLTAGAHTLTFVIVDNRTNAHGLGIDTVDLHRLD
jgi:hypothetical protein